MIVLSRTKGMHSGCTLMELPPLLYPHFYHIDPPPFNTLLIILKRVISAFIPLFSFSMIFYALFGYFWYPRKTQRNSSFTIITIKKKIIFIFYYFSMIFTCHFLFFTFFTKNFRTFRKYPNTTLAMVSNSRSI